MTCFWKHNWGKWKHIDGGTLQRYSIVEGKDHDIGKFIVIEKKCKDCDLPKRKTIKYEI